MFLNTMKEFEIEIKFESIIRKIFVADSDEIVNKVENYADNVLDKISESYNFDYNNYHWEILDVQ